MPKKIVNTATVEIAAAADAPVVPFVSFAQYCRDNGLNAKSMRAKLRRYQVSKPHNHSRNYDYNALVTLNAELDAKRAAAAAVTDTPDAE